MLAGVGEVEAEHLGRATGTGVRRRWRPSGRRRRRRRSRRACTSRRGRPGVWWCVRWTASSAQSWRETTVGWAPSPTRTSTTCGQRRAAGVVEHDGRPGVAPKRTTTWPASVTSASCAGQRRRRSARRRRCRPARRRAASTAPRRARARAKRVLGTRPLTPRSARASSPSDALDADAVRGVPGARRGAAARTRRRRAGPRSRLSGVKRQISSRPVGTAWSATSKEPTGCRWLSTLSTSRAVRNRIRDSHYCSTSLSVRTTGGAGGGADRRRISRRRPPSAARSGG